MNSLEQYIDIYRENSEAIDAHSAPVMNAARPRALASLDGRHLPVLGDEGYEKTSVDAMLAADYGLNFNRVGIPVNVAASFRCGVPNMSTLLGVVVNDEFHESKNLHEKLPDGVLYMSLKKAAEQYPKLVSPYYGHIASADNVPAALNTLLAQDGVFVYVPAGVTVEKPLQLVNIFSSPAPLMVARRMLVVVGDGASVQLLDATTLRTADSVICRCRWPRLCLAATAVLIIMTLRSHRKIPCVIRRYSPVRTAALRYLSMA